MSVLRDPKRLLATLIGGVAGLIVLLDFFGRGGAVALLARLFVDWAATITALALLVGLLSVLSNHVTRVARRMPDSLYSVVLLASLAATVTVGLLVPTLIEPQIRLLFRYIYQPLASSLVALLAFYSLSAALRALQSRRADALVLLAVAALLLLAQLPQVAGLPLLGPSLAWLESYPVLAGTRGLLIAASIGALVAGVRVLLGLDQPYLDR
jgi:hypothetical protein